MLVIIPARGGSKGLPEKNIRLLNGKPLIQYTIDAAREVFEDKEIIVSTDDKKIKETVEKTGLKVPFLRPNNLANDKTGMYDVLLHALNYKEQKGFFPETLILLQPTSPFRRGMHIKQALKLYDSSLDMVVSVKETKSNPYYVLKEENEDGYLVNSKKGNFIRRQDCPKVWELNGAIYVINIKSLKKVPMKDFMKVKKFEMDEISSIDIDDIHDFMLADFLIKNSQISFN